MKEFLKLPKSYLSRRYHDSQLFAPSEGGAHGLNFIEIAQI